MNRPTAAVSFRSYGGTAPENYERYFVPAIGTHFAADLLDVAQLRPGERVLDVACGTGIVARQAAERVGDGGSVTGLDANPGMLAVARTVSPPGTSVEWQEGGAEDMPFPDEAFDVVLCSLSLQFVPDRAAAVREMHRVLAPRGRVAFNGVGPTPPPFAILAEALARHVNPEAGGFVEQVFSLHDPGEIEGLLDAAGFVDVAIERNVVSLTLPPPRDLLWQYIHSTPLAAALEALDEQQLEALERDVVGQWQSFAEGDAVSLQSRVVVASASRA